jgi:predicted transcriptional regulator
MILYNVIDTFYCTDRITVDVYSFSTKRKAKEKVKELMMPAIKAKIPMERYTSTSLVFTNHDDWYESFRIKRTVLDE